MRTQNAKIITQKKMMDYLNRGKAMSGVILLMEEILLNGLKKASESNLSGVTVMLLPARTETRWFIDYVYPFATELRFIYGRLKFNDEAGSAPFPSVIAIYDRRAKPWKAISL